MASLFCFVLLSFSGQGYNIVHTRERKYMLKKSTAVITKEEKWYVARCVELGVVSQGKTIEKAQANLKEAVGLYIESFEKDDFPH